MPPQNLIIEGKSYQQAELKRMVVGPLHLGKKCWQRHELCVFQLLRNWTEETERDLYLQHGMYGEKGIVSIMMSMTQQNYNIMLNCCIHANAGSSSIWHSKLAGMNPSASQDLATISLPSTPKLHEKLKVPTMRGKKKDVHYQDHAIVYRIVHAPSSYQQVSTMGRDSVRIKKYT